MASSSSSFQARSIASPKLYDVFISHRGPDVKKTLAKQLYDLLKARECKAFLDREEIEGGYSITSAIYNAICSSRVQVAIFSKGYADSAWCLDELVLMLKQRDAVFIPVFYGVKPGELRYIDASKTESRYAAAFSNYRRKERNLDKLHEWRKALASAADISGYELGQHQGNLCQKIVSRVVQVVGEKEKSKPLRVAIYPVGLDELVKDFLRCCPNTTGMVGIYGLGGAGKTTLARELFNRKRSSYTASCFLSDVRESHARRDLHSLQKQLFKDLFRIKDQEIEINNVDDGIGKLKDRLGRAKHLNFLIVLDDIDNDQDQIHALLPRDTLGPGSLAIITTRDQGKLRDADVRYKIREMEKPHAKELFCSHAFHKRDPPSTYEELVESFVEYCGGLPLSLMVLGAHVYRRDQHYWELELEKARKIQPKDIMQRLKISFDSLDREEKQIFIDIACMFNKRYSSEFGDFITIWKASGWSAEHALQTLKDKCLVEVDLDTFKMHDHLRDLGRQMADELGPPRLWKPDILKSMETKGFEKIIQESKGRSFHSFYDSSFEREITYFVVDSDLRWLKIGGGSVNSVMLPPGIPLLKLQILDVMLMSESWNSFQQKLQANTQATLELRKLRIWYFLAKPPYWSMEMLNHLEELEIYDSLEEADTTSLVQSLQHLSNLRSLCLWYIFPFQRTPYERGGGDSINLDSSTSSCLKRLETIRLLELQTISKLVISGERCPRLRSLDVWRLTYLKQIELKQLESLNALTLDDCPKLETVSGSSLTGLRQLEVIKCKGLRSLPSLAHLRRLKQIRIVDCPQLQSVEGIEELPGLENLVIQMPDDGYASGLKMPLVKRTILTQKAMPGASAKLTANLFSEVIGDAAVSEVETGQIYSWENKWTIESSPSAITIYTLLVKAGAYLNLTFEDEVFCDGRQDTGNLLITFLLNQSDSKDRLHYATVKKGFKAIVKVEEERKALIVLQRIVDRLYTHRKGPNLAAYNAVKRKRKLKH